MNQWLHEKAYNFALIFLNFVMNKFIIYNFLSHLNELIHLHWLMKDFKLDVESLAVNFCLLSVILFCILDVFEACGMFWVIKSCHFGLMSVCFNALCSCQFCVEVACDCFSGENHFFVFIVEILGNEKLFVAENFIYWLS